MHPSRSGARGVTSPVAIGNDLWPAGYSTLAELLQLLDNAPPSNPGDIASRLPVSLRRVPAGQHLIHAGAESVALYFVRCGTFKIARNDEEGYEQVLAFPGQGDLLAYDALCATRHPTCAVALEDSTVFGVLRSDLADFCHQVPAFERALHRAASQALVRTNDLLDIMAAVSSEVRLARFLLQLSRQLAAKGQSPRRFVLRMGRRDLASLLGVAHETVSRSFTTLASARLLLVHDRDVEILDMAALRAFSRSTRRPAEDVANFRIRAGVPIQRAAQSAQLAQRLQA